jgi:VWFA-related protein
MYRHAAFLLLAAASLFAADETIVFKSDVALVRVDAQVIDRSNRAITGLRPEDFIIYEEGQQQQIRNFARENLPVDVLFLVDVSGSMQPHVQRLANAAHQALGVLGEGDRVGIMVFDRSSRIRLRLTQNPVASAYQFDRILQEESFNGGTDITRGLLDAASYIGREGRRDARKAIVILTDDQTERNREDAQVGSALTRADAVLMALIAPDAMMSQRYPQGGGGYPGGGYPQGGSRYPRRSGGLGGIILGGPIGGGWPGGGYPGGRYPGGGGGGGRYPGGGGVQIGGHTRSAGTADIARQSGGDSANIDDSNALQDTLERIRNRYALYFYLPQNAKAGTERNIEVALSASARQRYQGADVRYRQRYLAPGAGSAPDTIDAEPVVVSQSPDGAVSSGGSSTADDSEAGTGLHRRRRPAVDDSGGSRGPNVGGWPAASGSGGGGGVLAPAGSGSDTANVPPPAQPQQDQGGWKRSGDADATTSDVPAPAEKTVPAPATTTQQPQPEPEQKGGWRRVKPGEQP